MNGDAMLKAKRGGEKTKRGGNTSVATAAPIPEDRPTYNRNCGAVSFESYSRPLEAASGVELKTSFLSLQSAFDEHDIQELEATYRVVITFVRHFLFCLTFVST
jgi:hypothetical protein